jgi:hypothetical protein
MRLDGRGGFMALDDSKINDVQKQFQALTSVASSLNAASDALTKVVATLDEALKKLNVGLPAWVTFRFRIDENPQPGDYDEDQIGYCKIRGTWGIALRHIWGNTKSADGDSEGPWLFNDAPRDMRIDGVDDIPKLIQELCKRATETTKMVVDKTQEVRELASAITQIANPEKQATKVPAAPPPYVRKQTPPAQPPPYAKAPNSTLADMAAPNSPPLEPPSQPDALSTLQDLARGKKGGK